MNPSEYRRRSHRRRPPETGKRYDIEAIVALMSDGRNDDLRELFGELHAKDLVALIMELPHELRLRVLFLVGDVRAGDILDDLPDRIKYEVLTAVDIQQRQRLFAEMASDEVADFLSGLHSDKAMEFMQEMNADDRQEMQELLNYDPDSAGGLMNTDFVAFPREITVAEALDRLPQEDERAELIYYIYVVAGQGRLVGALSLRQLILAQPEQRLGDIAATNLLKLKVNSSREEAVEILTRYDLLAVPVVDDEMVLRGVITHDHIADIISAEATGDVYALGGVRVGEEESEWELSAWQRAWRRLPWLVVCIFGGLIGGQIISFYDEILTAVVALSFFMPIQIDTAGNVATQSVAIVVRGLATGELDYDRIWRYVFREAFIGVFIGLVCGTILALSAMFMWQQSPRFGIAVGCAMALTLVVSSFLGSFFPLLAFRFKIDPAVASGPLVATVLDCIGLIIYFASTISILGIIS